MMLAQKGVVAGAAAVLALSVAALAWVLLSVTEPELSDPGLRADLAVRAVSLNLPPIQPLAHYYGAAGEPWADLNPFVPLAERQRDLAIIARARQRPIQVRPVAPPQAPAPPKAPELPTAPTFPRASFTVLARPEAVGLISGPAGMRLLARVGEGAAVSLGLGEQLQGWTFVAVEGGRARFRDPNGLDHLLVIGATEATPNQIGQVSSADTAGGEAGSAATEVTAAAAASGGSGRGPARTGAGGGDRSEPITPPTRRPPTSASTDLIARIRQVAPEYADHPMVLDYVRRNPKQVEAILNDPKRLAELLRNR